MKSSYRLGPSSWWATRKESLNWVAKRRQQKTVELSVFGCFHFISENDNESAIPAYHCFLDDNRGKSFRFIFFLLFCVFFVRRTNHKSFRRKTRKYGFCIYAVPRIFFPREFLFHLAMNFHQICCTELAEKRAKNFAQTFYKLKNNSFVERDSFFTRCFALLHNVDSKRTKSKSKA